jgi:hypothetical protein
MKRHLAAALAATILLPLAGAALAQEGHGTLVDAVRAANERFADPAIATAEGYVAMPCVSGPAGGAMGIHMANPPLLEDGVIDIAKPEALLYEPQPDGSMELLAVEYITFAPNRYGLDPFYELHVWAWRENPSGTFADFNPTVSCDAMRGEAGMAH